MGTYPGRVGQEWIGSGLGLEWVVSGLNCEWVENGLRVGQEWVERVGGGVG